LSAVATAGMMGNMYYEGSELSSTNTQNSFEDRLPFINEKYAEAVDSGTYSANSFINDGVGFGLCQWTVSTRKEALLNFAKARGVSIGNFSMQLAFIIWELTESDEYNVRDVWPVLSATNSIREATKIVLYKFENPRDKSDTMLNNRAAKAQEYYDKFNNLNFNQ
jgi:hypothetical protein